MKTVFSCGSVHAAELSAWCGGALRGGIGAEIEIKGICTDSREADASVAFCALRGERVDGHDYIEAALANGCRCVICERSCEALEQAGAAAIVVGDVELSLAYLGSAYKRELSCSTVAVTGSVGKTTTKDMIASVLSVRHKTFKTAGNHNSVIGLPLSVTEIPQDTAWAVLEMGMSGFGEIERLSEMAQPDVAVITNIGTAHMEMLGSRENICRAKLEVLCGLRTGGLLLLNGDEPLLSKVGGKSYRTVYVSTERENAAFFAKNIRVGNNQTTFDLVWAGGEEKNLSIRVMGKHNVYAAMFAFAIGVMSGMKPEEIKQGLLAFTPEGLRQKVTSCGDWTFLEDCYNASPESMTAALDVLHDYCHQTGRTGVAVLGGMMELGVESAMLHRRVGAYLSELGLRRLVAIGEKGAQIALGAQQRGMDASRIVLLSGEDPQESARELRQLLTPADAVLFKASRAVGAERIIEALKDLTQTHSENVEI